ncbi:DUF2243 domain-containing protein [Pseudotabrizicola sediminis]|uniref:DUF2243 domain-containing protein n=1 Tax=Pseudotabrizicola sediminis TaxID=2486418 RepID=A0ABY2KLC7_9RHOB|nr:DUF2243 domain-containing protein [Pseudotabrizicola sediminis]TGD41654.1 DUF2243 domain-containing protein [Pseudotabrizicola sediminis]
MTRAVVPRPARARPVPPAHSRRSVAPGILLGLGLGGFFDGIVLHQILQWHHMLSCSYPPITLVNLQLNTLADGLFHAAAYVFVAAGVFLLWRQARKPGFTLSGRVFTGSLLIGFGIFNLVEGVINHHLLGIHHVNETVLPHQWLWWDLGFLAWGAAMLTGGLYMLKPRQRRET